MLSGSPSVPESLGLRFAVAMATYLAVYSERMRSCGVVRDAGGGPDVSAALQTVKPRPGLGNFAEWPSVRLSLHGDARRHQNPEPDRIR